MKILLSGKQEEAVCEEASRIAKLLREAAAPGASKTNKDQGGLFDLKKTGTGAIASRPRILGPAPAPLTRLQGKFRIQILIKSPTSAVNQQLLERVEGKLKPRRGVDLLCLLEESAFHVRSCDFQFQQHAHSSTAKNDRH